MSSQQGQLRIAAPKPVYPALHHRSFVLQGVRVEGEGAPGQSSGEPREPEPSGEPTRTSAFSLSSASTEKPSGPTPVMAFHQNQQPPGSFHQQLPVLQPSQQPAMIQSHPPPSSHPQPPSVISSRAHHSTATSVSPSMSFANSRIGSKTPPALFNPASNDASSTTRPGQIKSQSLGSMALSPPLSGGRPLPAVPLVSQDPTTSSRSLNAHRSASDPSVTPGTGFVMSSSPRSSASHGSSTSSKSPHTHLVLSTTSMRTKTPPALISTASGSSTAFPMSSDITAFDGDHARGGNGSNTMHGTHAQGAQGVTHSYAFHQNQNQSTSSSPSSALFGSAAFVSSPPPLSSPPPPPPPPSAMVAMTASPLSGHVPGASVGAGAMISTATKSGGTSMEGAGNWSVSRDRRGSNANSGAAVINSNNSNSSKIINSANNSGSSTNSSTALVRPLPLPPGSTPRTRTRSNNASNVLGGPPGSHTSSVNVLALPISWASRPVDLNRSGERQQHQQHTLQQHHLQQPGQQIQQGQQGQQHKTYSRPPSRPSLPSSRPSSRPSSPSARPISPPSNLAFGPGPSPASSASAGAGAAVVGAGRSSSPLPRSKTITSATRSNARGGRLRSRSTSRPRTQISAGAGAGVLRYESFSGVGAAMGTSAAAPAMTSPTAPPNTAPPQARLAPQGSRTLPSARKRSATESLDSPSTVTITKSQPVGSALTALTTQPMSRQASKPSAIPSRSTPPQSQLPSPPSVSHHHGISHGHASSSGLTSGHNTSLLTPPTHTTTQSAQSSGSKRHQGGVQLPRQLVSRAAAVPAPLNTNYNCVGVARGGVYYVRDKDPYPYHQRRQDEKGKEPETITTTTSVTKRTFPVRPLPKPAMVQPLSSDKQPAGDAGIDASAEDGGKATIDNNDNDNDDGISCLSYIDSPDSAIGVHPDLGSLSFDDMGLSDDGGDGERGREDPLLVYIDDNFDSSDEGEEFAKSVSPMRYARPGSDGTVDSADDGGSDISSDFFSDVDDPFKYNKGRSKRRGRTRTTVPVGLSGSSNETAGVGAGAKEKLGIRMTGSLGSMRDLIEGKAAKEKRKKEAADAGGGGGVGGTIPARTKSAERDRALPQRYGHPQESPLPPPPPRLIWFTPSGGKVSLNEGDQGGAAASIGGGGGDKVISPVSLSSSQGGRSLSPMRYAKRMSVELLDDSSSLGSPISPIGVGGLLKGKSAKLAAGRRRKRSQPWSYQFDYQAAKASSPFTFGMGGETAATEEEKKKVEEGKKRDKAKSVKGSKTKEESEGRKKLSIDVLDISLLRRSSQPALLEPGTTDAGDDVFGLDSDGGGGGGSGGSGQQTFRTWDNSPASSATASSFTVIAAPGTNNTVVTTPPVHHSSPPIATTSPPPFAQSTGTVGRTRTLKVRNP